MHFARMLLTPATSNTARIGPPAMIPVPSDAGCISTLDAPCRPITACCSVPFRRLTRNIFRRASSSAFCTATGTSRALPLPMPTAPPPSPTTVSAANPSTRPPFTTLVTRFTETIFSRRPSVRSSGACILGLILAIGSFLRYLAWDFDEGATRPIPAVASKLEPALARGLGERLHAPVIPVAAAIERHFADPQLLRLLRDALAHDRSGRLVAALRHLGPKLLLRSRGGDEHLRAVAGNDLSVDVLIRPMHREPHDALAALPQPRLRRPADPGLTFVDHGRFAIPSLLLRFLEHHHLVGVAHPLALVRLGRPVAAHGRGDLPDELLVEPLDHDLGLGRRVALHPLRHLVHDRVGEAERQIQLVPLRLGA